MNIPLSHWIVFVGVCAFVAWLNGRRSTPTNPVQTSAKPLGVRAPCGCEYRDGQWIACRQHGVVLPPDGNWCGCCGRPAPEPWLWCDDCLFHVALAGEKPLHERTWYAQHGTICPFTDRDDGERDVGPDGVPEGLGVTPAPRPSPVSASGQWTAAERALFDEIHDRVAR